MSSIVRELQLDAVSNKVSISELLRKALLVATKLKQVEFIEWLNHELNGYPIDSREGFPMYRQVRGVVKAFNPYHGAQQVFFENEKEGELYSTRFCSQSVPELDHLLSNAEPNGVFEMKFSDTTVKMLMEKIGFDLVSSLHVESSALFKILDSIRNTILRWSLKLEEDGVLGENLSFSKDDQRKVETASYNITNFLGPIMGSQIQQGTHSSSQSRDF
ncbi:hypothetical protein DAY19_14350 [Halobacteriovorax vibrionivorans]|uniref:AbiTii domain-containing protein n=1 Tax=Halobacteriovorax vibrionivorans TaxID=2152716 RepID=A0ABY0IF74_9BACT|nr:MULTISPECIES: hypothetical protein [Halobacteriovorax]RZF21155.1 hypothetical protein DAY19_14350 [Halobacteriovorax vibrionivorans]TGD46249.1 hypothetical protein EP118_12670 [Halobacteriovorax sp. Y22]